MIINKSDLILSTNPLWYTLYIDTKERDIVQIFIDFLILNLLHRAIINALET